MTISRKVRNALRRERRANPSVRVLMARRRAETEGKRAIREHAEALLARYGRRGVTWAACVQAVKTGWVAQFEGRYGGRGVSDTEK